MDVDFTYIRRPQLGRGRNKLLKGFTYEQFTSKTCIVKIRNNDDLCCARAIVTMRARHFKDQTGMHKAEYENLKRGRGIQEMQARELHRQAQVPEGSCGEAELRKFQNVLSPDFQIAVFKAEYPLCITFKGPDAPLKIVLAQWEDHFDGS